MALVENRRFAQFAQNYAIRVSDFVRFFPRGQRGLTVPGSAVWASEWESDRRTSIAKTANELAAPVGLALPNSDQKRYSSQALAQVALCSVILPPPSFGGPRTQRRCIGETFRYQARLTDC